MEMELLDYRLNLIRQTIPEETAYPPSYILVYLTYKNYKAIY